MRFGLYLSTPERWSPSMRLDTMLEMACRAQAGGFDVVVVGQHYGESPQHLLQPVPLLARLAGAVASIRLATGVLLGSLLNPYEIAESIATLDVLSGGRAVLGVGAGHRPQESAAFGKVFTARGADLEACVTTIRWLFGKTIYHGQPTTGLGLGLHPQQGTALPIWVAGTSDGGVRRAARVGDAWYVGPGTSLAALQRQLRIYSEQLAGVGRPLPAVLPVRRDIFLCGDARTSAVLADDLARRFSNRRASGYAGDLPAGDRTAGTPTGRDPRRWRDGDLEVVAGDVEQCREQLGAIAQTVPAEALVVLRVGWHDWAGRDLVDHVDALVEMARPLMSGAGGRTGEVAAAVPARVPDEDGGISR